MLKFWMCTDCKVVHGTSVTECQACESGALRGIRIEAEADIGI